MRNSRATHRAMALACVSAALALMSATGAEAQQRRNPMDILDRSNQHARELDELHREARRPSRPHSDPDAERQRQLIFAQVKEDFEQMQAVNLQLMRRCMRSEALDYRQVFAAAAEIHQRARRLKEYMALPASKEKRKPDVKPGASPEAMRKALLALDRLILSFAHNPMFQTPNVLSLEQAMQARRDLEAIVWLSGAVKKASKKPGRSATP